MQTVWDGETKCYRIRVALNFEAWLSLSVSWDAACSSSAVIISAGCVLLLIWWIWFPCLFNPRQTRTFSGTMLRDEAYSCITSTDKLLQRSRVDGEFGINVRLPPNSSLHHVWFIMCDIGLLPWGSIDCCVVVRIAHIKEWVMIFVEMELHNKWRSNLNCQNSIMN